MGLFCFSSSARRWAHARAGLAALMLLVACDREPIQRCGTIPLDGCPVGRGGTCEDPYCAALYDCVDGAWILAETCGPVEVGGAGGGGVGGGVSNGTGGCDGGVMFDHSDEKFGCKPDLLPPDCPAVAAEGCGAPCLTGCIDFFMCTKDGWELVAYCFEDGGDLVIVQGAE